MHVCVWYMYVTKILLRSIVVVYFLLVSVKSDSSKKFFPFVPCWDIRFRLPNSSTRKVEKISGTILCVFESKFTTLLLYDYHFKSGERYQKSSNFPSHIIVRDIYSLNPPILHFYFQTYSYKDRIYEFSTQERKNNNNNNNKMWNFKMKKKKRKEKVT